MKFSGTAKFGQIVMAFTGSTGTTISTSANVLQPKIIFLHQQRLMRKSWNSL
ncbi:MAG: hypothetical protein IPP49_07940 [Saprospiraceae bacterium]|nr:hypothetical protein [Saprospiraceae bacterium]